MENTSTLRVDLSFVHRLADLADLAGAAGTDMCADLFAAWTERDLSVVLAAHAEKLAVVQVADYVLGTFSTPARAVPGDGIVPITSQLAAVRASGFAGWIEVELIGPRIDAEGTARAGARAIAALEGMPG